jgi:hypothetical protein
MSVLDHAARARVQALLQDPEWQKKSARAVAQAASTTDTIVFKVRLAMGLPASALAERKIRLEALLEDPEWRDKPAKWIAAEVGVDAATVRAMRQRKAAPAPLAPIGAPGARPITVRVAAPPRVRGLSPRHLALLSQIFEHALRGADVQSLVRSETGRQLHHAVIVARQGGPQSG